MPNQVIFKLNDDNTTYSVDCIYDSIKVNGEDTSMTIHSDKASFPANTDLFISTREVGVYNLKYDDFHLSCDVIKTGRYITKKLAYLWK